MPLLETLIKQALLEAGEEHGLDDRIALAAARIEERFILVDRTAISSLDLGGIPKTNEDLPKMQKEIPA